jgi:hypothetical protein
VPAPYQVGALTPQETGALAPHADAYALGFRQPAARQLRLTGAEAFWYVLQCIAFGAGYFAKVPAKKALEEAGLAEMTAAEKFWYVLQCIAFGAGYFAKLPVKKALTEVSALPRGV